MGKLTQTVLQITAILLFAPLSGHAQSVYLDSEFSDYCQKLTAPLLPSLAHHEGTRFVIVNGNEINAFVDGSKMVHVTSGLIQKSSNPMELQGVLAHELSHTAAQHIARIRQGVEKTKYSSIAGIIAGIGAMAAGAPQAGAAILTGSQAYGISNILRFSRTHEQEADRLAVAALHNAGYSVSGMLTMFEKLRLNSQLSYNAPPPYLLTHPLPSERLQSLKADAAREKPDLKQPVDDPAFTRLKAKVFAITANPAETLRKFSGSDAPSTYARAIAQARLGKLNDAKQTLAPLLKANPADPYYQELAAQIAVDNGQLAEAQTIFTKLVNGTPNDVLYRFQLAEIQRNLDNPTEAVGNYRQVLREWPDWAMPWNNLGLAYGQAGKLPQSHLALAEAALVGGDLPLAREQAARANNYLKKAPDTEAQAWVENLTTKLENAAKH